ncbi:MAG: methyltransferase [Methylococcales bacterium]|nr:methyltransferase [Methylococcales bacterium]
MLTQIILFILLSIFIIAFSWKPLHNPRAHGFYRFFAFESILILILMNDPFWHLNPLSILQIISWVLLSCSILFAIQGYYLLRTRGGEIQPRVKNTENIGFENTTQLVITGIYHYIRHPMYASLMLLTWGGLF